MNNIKKDIMGVIHFSPFDEGGIDYSKLKAWTDKQIEAYIEGGIKKIILQDQTPGKITDMKTITYMAALGRGVKEKYPETLLGIILESNNGEDAMLVANAAGADFVRSKVFVGAMVRAGGIIEGNYKQVRKAKHFIDRKIEIYADIYDRMGTPIGDMPIETMAQQAVKFGADKLVITGDSDEETIDLIKRVKKKCPDTDILIGGGVNLKNANELIQCASGAIVSSCFLADNDKVEWDKEKIKKFMMMI